MSRRLTVRHGFIVGSTISAIAIASVVAMGPLVAEAASAGIVGNGTNGSPYTVSNCPQPSSEGRCTIEFNSISLKGFESKDTPAYLCPKNYPYLFAKDYSPGRIVPGGVQVNEPGGIGVTISGLKLRPDGTELIKGTEVPVYYISGISSGLGGATNWDPFKTKSYSITLHCTVKSAEGYRLSYVNSRSYLNNGDSDS